MREVGIETFLETHASVNTEENMRDYLRQNFSAGKIRADLTDPNIEFYFSKLEDKVIGYLKLNFGASQTDIKDGVALEIERIYVLNQYQGSGIGKLFYYKSIEVATQRRLDYI